jgi:hypothetical protein
LKNKILEFRRPAQQKQLATGQPETLERTQGSARGVYYRGVSLTFGMANTGIEVILVGANLETLATYWAAFSPVPIDLNKVVRVSVFAESDTLENG